MNPVALLTRADALAPMPLTVRQLALLLYLGSVGTQDFSGVHEALGFSPPVLTRAANAMAGARLLQRLPSRDRRVPLLALTKAGEKLVAELAGAP